MTLLSLFSEYAPIDKTAWGSVGALCEKKSVEKITSEIWRPEFLIQPKQLFVSPRALRILTKWRIQGIDWNRRSTSNRKRRLILKHKRSRR